MAANDDTVPRAVFCGRLSVDCLWCGIHYGKSDWKHWRVYGSSCEICFFHDEEKCDVMKAYDLKIMKNEYNKTITACFVGYIV